MVMEWRATAVVAILEKPSLLCVVGRRDLVFTLERSRPSLKFTASQQNKQREHASRYEAIARLGYLILNPHKDHLAVVISMQAKRPYVQPLSCTNIAIQLPTSLLQSTGHNCFRGQGAAAFFSVQARFAIYAES